MVFSSLWDLAWPGSCFPSGFLTPPTLFLPSLTLAMLAFQLCFPYMPFIPRTFAFVILLPEPSAFLPGVLSHLKEDETSSGKSLLQTELKKQGPFHLLNILTTITIATTTTTAPNITIPQHLTFLQRISRYTNSSSPSIHSRMWTSWQQTANVPYSWLYT